MKSIITIDGDRWTVTTGTIGSTFTTLESAAHQIAILQQQLLAERGLRRVPAADPGDRVTRSINFTMTDVELAS